MSIGDVIRADLCIIGAGAGGLSVAAGAAQMGASVVLIERGAMGGDCLNTGCVPSKALLASASAAAMGHVSRSRGVICAPIVDFAAVNRRVHATIDEISRHDSVERFEGLGVRVIAAHGWFADSNRVVTDQGHVIHGRRYVIATGARPSIPPVPGLADAPFLTNETVFALQDLPAHLVIIGGGAIGCEMAQAFVRLGSRVTLVDQGGLLPRDDLELVAVVRRCLIAEGVDVHENTRIHRVTQDRDGVCLFLDGDRPLPIRGDRLLVATGRKPDTAHLNLEAAGITETRTGIHVDAGLRTTNRRVFAIGDVIGGAGFTHVASYHAGIVLRRALLRLPARVDDRAVPRVVYTSPELAQIGVTEMDARARYGSRVRVVSWPFSENDRARTDGVTEGMVKAIVRRDGHILGAGIVGEHAGELIQTWGLAMHARLSISRMASVIAPYPTLGEASKRAAAAFYTPRLFGPTMRRIVGWLGRLG